ncbi:MAG: TIGR03084 family metal-binding protein, partial [Acidimicrobiia bacterium]
LDAVVAGLSDERWDDPTPSPGWTVRDQIAHLTYFDGTATLAITDPDAFPASLAALGPLLARGEGAMDDETLGWARSLAPAEVLDRWRAGRAALAEAAEHLQDADRVPWYGPSMGAKSFVTARLMECWAHGQDVVDAVGGSRPATDRLAHIVRLGVITRGWTYANRGEEPPAAEVRVDLGAPSGERWTFVPARAADVVTGPAEDFCLVVTQRRHVDDTALDVRGPAARDWMEKAQAFAGPPTQRPG